MIPPRIASTAAQERSPRVRHTIQRIPGRLDALLGRIGVLVLAMFVLGATTSAYAEGSDDLDQTLGDDETVTAPLTVESGHVDLGPKFGDDGWQFMVHAEGEHASTAWYDAERTVFRVPDFAAMTAPDSDEYEFLDDVAGDRVYVLPQTQDTDVPWLGWNTQDPEVMEKLDRGATLSVTGVQGPGDVAVFLQSGSFGAPEVLWDTTKKTPQSVWVDVNTHTHANWVFTKPGVYVLEVQVQADLVDGTHVSDTAHLRFAVGDGTSAKKARDATWKPVNSWGSAPRADGVAAASDAQDASSAEDGTSALTVAFVVAVVLVLVLVFVVVLRSALRARRDRARAFAQRATHNSQDPGRDDER